jgi:hypothetical protein
LEEKPIQKSNGLAVGSLCMGILGFITSILFLWILESFFVPNLSDSLLPEWLLLVLGWPVSSSLIGLIGISLGIISLKKTTVSNRIAKAGIIFGVLALLGGFPLIWFATLFIPD